MEVPVVKIREDEAGGEEKSVIKSIVNMVQYGSSSVCPSVCWGGGGCEKLLHDFLIHADNSPGGWAWSRH